jgi:hypothetical protein
MEKTVKKESYFFKSTKNTKPTPNGPVTTYYLSMGTKEQPLVGEKRGKLCYAPLAYRLR